MPSTSRKTITLTIVGTVVVMLILEAVAGWLYLNMPTPIPYAPTASASSTPVFPKSTLATVAGNNFSNAAETVYTDMIAIKQLNGTKLNPIFGDLQPRFFESRYAGAFSLMNAARGYAQQGETLANKFVSDVRTLGQSVPSSSTQASPVVRAQLTSAAIALQRYASTLSDYYAAMNVVLVAYPFATAKQTDDLRKAADNLRYAADTELVPQINLLLSGGRATTTTATAGS